LAPIVFEAAQTHDTGHGSEFVEHPLLVDEPPNGPLVRGSRKGHFDHPRITGRMVFRAADDGVHSLVQGFPERTITQLRHDVPSGEKGTISEWAGFVKSGFGERPSQSVRIPRTR
jgi:hypothetical protein